MMNVTSTPTIAAPEIPLVAPVGAASILVPLDGTEQALAALPVAQAIAELEIAALHVAHISERVLPADELLRRLGLQPADVRGSIVDQARGLPAEGIVQLARELRSRYIVMCTHTGESEMAEALGAVAKEVVCQAPCPVVLVPPARGNQPYSLRRALLPHDGTPSTTGITPPLADLVHRAHAQLIVLHLVGPGESQPTEPGSIPAPQYVDQPQHEWPAWAREFLHRAGLPPAQVPNLRLAAAPGATGEGISQFGGENAIDLIGLGWHSAWTAEHAKTVKAVLRHATCPVLLVRVAEHR